MVGLIPRGQPWAQQPPASEPLERSNRLASSALVLVNGPRVHGTPAVRLAPLRGTPQLGVCRFGTGASFTSSAAQSFTAGTARSILAAEDFTIEVLCAMTAVPSLAGFFGTEYPGVIGGATRALIGFGGGSNRNIYFWGQAADLASGVDWRIDGSLQHVFCVRSGSSMRFYRDGREIAAGTTPTLANTTGTEAFVVGDMNAGWASTPTGTIMKAAFHTRAFSAGEIAQLTRNAWQVFNTIVPDVVDVAAGAGGAVGLATEVDTAMPLGAVQIRAVGLATEADTALARTAVQLRSVGLASETDTALALGRVQIRAVGLATETDTALARGAVQIRPAGLATETDTALALAPGSAPGTVGVAVETDTALALGARQIRPVGLAVETSTALARPVVVARGVGLALEIDAAFARPALLARQVGRADETDTAFALGSGGVVVVPETHGRLDARSAGNTGGSYARPAQGSGAARPTQTTSARPRQK